MPAPELKTDQLLVLMPPSLRIALERAAARRFMSDSEYTRQSIINAVRADGIDPCNIDQRAA